MENKILNIAIIAHVDHGKTTLVDQILKFCSGLDKKEETERVMDSNDLEKERGITILSKNTAVNYNDIKINIVDTPGHSDFGGEVERILKMVDTCLLLVDAFEGPMPQTRFVLNKALEMNHKIILVINKIDRPHCDVDNVIDKTLELFLDLNATDEQIEFPIVYTSAKEGYALNALTDEKNNIEPLLQTILEHAIIKEDRSHLDLLFQVTTLDYNEFLGRICIGRVFQGSLEEGSKVFLKHLDSKKQLQTTEHKITKLFTFLGLKRIEIKKAQCHDIIAVAGIPDMTIGDTLCLNKEQEPIERIQIEPPTVSMLFFVNDAPFSGQDGKFVTSRNIKERLEKEIKVNLSLQIKAVGESYEVLGRGELQLAILIENMRREGFELSVSKPQVIFKEENGQKVEPYEEVIIDLPETYSGGIIQELNRRKGEMIHMENLANEGYSRIRYQIPTRGIIGFRSFFLTETRGEGAFSSIFIGYKKFSGSILNRKKGVLVSMENGKAAGYALFNLQDRGELFIGPQTQVYTGMIIGAHSKETDLDINPIKEKKLSNVRASGSDDALKLTPHKKLTLEQCLDFLEEDELLEATPHYLRLRKKVLNPSLRKRG